MNWPKDIFHCFCSHDLFLCVTVSARKSYPCNLVQNPFSKLEKRICTVIVIYCTKQNPSALAKQNENIRVSAQSYKHIRSPSGSFISYRCADTLPHLAKRRRTQASHSSYLYLFQIFAFVVKRPFLPILFFLTINIFYAFMEPIVKSCVIHSPFAFFSSDSSSMALSMRGPFNRLHGIMVLYSVFAHCQWQLLFYEL